MVAITILTSVYGYSGWVQMRLHHTAVMPLHVKLTDMKLDKMIPSAKNYMKCVKK